MSDNETSKAVDEMVTSLKGFGSSLGKLANIGVAKVKSSIDEYQKKKSDTSDSSSKSKKEDKPEESDDSKKEDKSGESDDAKKEDKSEKSDKS